MRVARHRLSEQLPEPPQASVCVCAAAAARTTEEAAPSEPRATGGGSWTRHSMLLRQLQLRQRQALAAWRGRDGRACKRCEGWVDESGDARWRVGVDVALGVVLLLSALLVWPALLPALCR